MSEQAGSVLAGNPAPEAAAGGVQPEAVSVPEWAASLSETARTVVANKKWSDPSAAIESYASLEKYLGADKAGRGLVLPKDDAPPEEWGQVFVKLGKPESPDGYQIPVPEGDDGAFAKMVTPLFHQANLTARQAEALATGWNELVTQQQAAEQEKWAQESTIQVDQLKKEWGSTFDANAALAQRAIREAGASTDEATAIERAIGVKRAAEIFAALGKQYAESPIRDGEGRQMVTTPESARARLKALAKDTGFYQRLSAGDAAANEEWTRLNTIAASA